MVWMIIIGVILIIVSFAIMDGDRCFISMPCALSGTALLVLGCVLLEEKDVPKAIDVYNGKTTLEITYRDSVPVDTVVVFKKEYRK